MSVDQHIREGLTRVGADLPEPDAGAALDAVLSLSRSRDRRRVVVGSAAAATAGVLVVLGSVFGPGGGEGSPAPVSPASTAEREESLGADQRLTRPRATAELPVATPRQGGGRAATPVFFDVVDPADTEPGWVDVTRIRVENQLAYGYAPVVRLDLGERFPPRQGEAWADVEYGLVLDLDGDRVADCELGIATATQVPLHYRVWARELDRTLVEQVGPPYGIPFEFAHPEEQLQGLTDRMQFIFGDFATACHSPIQARHVYAWAALLEDGRPVTVDFAPDAGWFSLGPLRDHEGVLEGPR